MDAEEKKVLKNGAKVLGELILPGTSLLMEEKLPQGMAHVGAAVAAKLAFGAPAVALVAANSLSMSITGKGLYGHLMEQTARDPRDVSLKDKVSQDIQNGASFDEIKEDVLEDIEDLYREVLARIRKSEPASPASSQAKPAAGSEPK